MDPRAVETPQKSPYVAMSGDPIRRSDSTGEQDHICEGDADCDAAVDYETATAQAQVNTAPDSGMSNWSSVSTPEFDEHSVESFQRLSEAEWAISRTWVGSGPAGRWETAAWYRRPGEEWTRYDPCNFDWCGSARPDEVGGFVIETVASAGVTFVWRLGARTIAFSVTLVGDRLVGDWVARVGDDALRSSFQAYARETVSSTARTATTTAPVRLLSPGRTSSLIANALETREVEFAQEILAHRGGVLVGVARRSFRGIDGTLNGIAISLKQTEGGLAAVLHHASRAEGQAARAGYSGVEVFIRAPNVRLRALLEFARRGGLSAIPSQGSVSAISVLTADGWVRITAGRII